MTKRGKQHAALLIAFTHHRGAFGIGVQRIFHRPLQGGILLLHHNDLAQSLSKAAHHGLIQWDGHPQFQQPDASRRHFAICGQSQTAQRLA